MRTSTLEMSLKRTLFGYGIKTNFSASSPTRAITCNGGMKMPGWYDIIEIGTAAKGEDKVGLDASREYRTFLPSPLSFSALGPSYFIEKTI